MLAAAVPEESAPLTLESTAFLSVELLVVLDGAMDGVCTAGFPLCASLRETALPGALPGTVLPGIELPEIVPPADVLWGAAFL